MFTGFAKIEGIEGESKVKGFQKQIELLSFSHGVTQPIGSGAGGGTMGRSQHSDFSIVKTLDAASPILAKKCSDGTLIPEITITLLKQSGGGEHVKFMEYKLTDVHITGYRPGGSGQGDGLPLEEVSFSYDKITWTYNKTDGGVIAQSYNVKELVT